MDILKANSAVREDIGREKVDRALAEVAGKLNPEDDFRPLLDRAHEIGLHHDWDGTIELPEGLLIGGERIDAIVDLHAALNEDEAFSAGHIDQATYDLGKRISTQVDRAEPAEDTGAEFGVMSTTWNYGWGTATSTGFNRGAWAFDNRTHERRSTIRRHGSRGGRVNPPGSRWGGRVYYEWPGAGHNSRQWSNWRRESGSTGIRWADFGSNIATFYAQTGYTW